jgi:hypothetical protein
MRHKIYPAARRRIIEIWHYTDRPGVRNRPTNMFVAYIRLLKMPLSINICGGRLNTKM